MTADELDRARASAGQGDAGDDGRRPYSRRRLIAGAAAAAGAGVAATFAIGGRPAGAATPRIEGDDTPVLGGVSNDYTNATVVSATSGNGLWGITSQQSASGVYGEDISASPGGSGVAGFSQSGIGVVGATGYIGEITGTGPVGVLGTDGSAGTGPGVSAFLGNPSNDSPAMQAVTDGTGAAILAEIDNTSSVAPAIIAFNNGTGPAIQAQASGSAAIGFWCQGMSGATAYYATTDTGTAVSATAFDDSGTALAVEGVATFSRSGIAAVTGTHHTPARSVTVSGQSLTQESLVLATAQGKVAGVAIEGVVVDVAASSFTIYLTATVTVTLPIAYMIVN
jgi:hypothetical protein